MEKRILKGISSWAYEHPWDKASTGLLRSTPGLKQMVDFIGSFTSDKSLRLYFLANGVKISPTQMGDVHQLVQGACSILDMEGQPEVFLVNDPQYNAMAVGFSRPYLVLHSSLVKGLGAQELQGIIGHELGHIKSGHMAYKTVLWILANLSLTMIRDTTGLITLPIYYALLDWSRKAELTADRAALLTLQDPTQTYGMMAKIAAGGQFPGLNIEEVLSQAEEYDQEGDLFDSFYKLMNVLGATHPMMMMRIRELMRWVKSGLYEKIIQGEYPRTDEPNPGMDTIFQEAVNQFEEDLKTSQDPGAQLANQFLQGARDFGSQVEGFFRGLFPGEGP